MNKPNYIYNILLLLSVSFTKLHGTPTTYPAYHRNSQFSAEVSTETEKREVICDFDAELDEEDENYISNMLKDENIPLTTTALRGPISCVPLPARFPVSVSISTLGNVALGQTHTHDVRISSPVRIEAGDLLVIHTLPLAHTLVTINESRQPIRRVLCHRTSFVVFIRKDVARGRYNIFLTNAQAINPNEEVLLSFVVRAPRRCFNAIITTSLQARTESGRLRTIDAPTSTIMTQVGTTVGTPVVKTHTATLEALSA